MPLPTKHEEEFLELLVNRITTEANEALNPIIKKYVGLLGEKSKFVYQFEEGLVPGTDFLNWMIGKLNPPPASPDTLNQVEKVTPNESTRKVLEELRLTIEQLGTNAPDTRYIGRSSALAAVDNELAKFSPPNT